MAFLLDTNAISEAFRPRPNAAFADWLIRLPKAEQLTSSVVLAELYTAAYRSSNREKWFRRIESGVLQNITILPLDTACAKVCGRLRADLMNRGTPVDDPDLQIAATAIYHGLTLVTGNIRHFKRIPNLPLQTFEPGADGTFTLV